MPLRPFAEMLPTEFVTLSVNAVDWVEDVVLELAADAGAIAEAGKVMLISTELLWLPKRFPVAGGVGVIGKKGGGGAGGWTRIEKLLKSFFASSPLGAFCFFVCLIVVCVAVGSATAGGV